jgi:hypothetical protein
MRSRVSRDYSTTLEIDGPSATCGHCRFTSALKGKFSVEDGRLVWRADESPQPGRGPDLRSCCESSPVIRFERITAGDEELSTEDIGALRETDRQAEMRDCPWRYPETGD